MSRDCPRLPEIARDVRSLRHAAPAFRCLVAESQAPPPLGLSVTLHLNPSLQIDKFPLESFYRYVVSLEPSFDNLSWTFPGPFLEPSGRYVVSLEPSFDNAGRSLSPQLDRALFSSLRTPQVLTLHVDAPEAWLLECTEAAYDMDNLRLAELGERRRPSRRRDGVETTPRGCRD